MAPAPSLEQVIHLVETDASDEAPLSRLRAASGLVRDLAEVGDAALGYFVDQARRAGHSWSDIGDALGVSKQAAQQRHTVRDYLGPNRPTFERFTPRARNVLEGADPVARDWGHRFVGTEHLLLALYREPDGIAARILTESGLPADRAQAAVGERTERGSEVPEGQLTFSPKAKAVFSEALSSAIELGHNYIGTEHLLLGLSRTNGLADAVLSDAGITEALITAKVLEKLAPFEKGLRADKGGDRRRPAKARVPRKKT